MHTNHFVAMYLRSIDFDVLTSLRNKLFLNDEDKVFFTDHYHPSSQCKKNSGSQSCNWINASRQRHI